MDTVPMNNSETTTWKEELDLASKGDKIIACSTPKREMKTEFYYMLGTNTATDQLIAWSKEFVYAVMPNEFGGILGRVPRKPTKERKIT